MTVDLAKIRVGDEVLVRASFDRTTHDDGKVAVRFRGKSGYFDGGRDYAYVNREDIVSHTPAPRALAVGDLVRAKAWAATLTIVCIDDGWAWLKDGEYSRIQLPLSDLERAQ